MTDAANHLGLTLQEFLDDRLDGARQAEVRAHLQGCPQCRAELEALRWVRDTALKRLPAEAVPPTLAGRVTSALDEADRPARPAARPTIGPRWRKWASAGVAALLAVVALVLLVLSPSKNDLPKAVARDFAEYSSGGLALDLRSSDGEAVESLFAARGIDFRTRVFDLGMMQYQLVGARIHRLGNRASALFAYRGPEGRNLVCQMYEGRLASLPQPDEVRDHGGIRFQVYRKGKLTLVFWQEGAVVCVLASDAESDDVIQLAYAKAVKV
jgi:anti-sigma factor RsiW